MRFASGCTSSTSALATDLGDPSQASAPSGHCTCVCRLASSSLRFASRQHLSEPVYVARCSDTLGSIVRWVMLDRSALWHGHRPAWTAAITNPCITARADPLGLGVIERTDFTTRADTARTEGPANTRRAANPTHIDEYRRCACCSFCKRQLRNVLPTARLTGSHSCRVPPTKAMRTTANAMRARYLPPPKNSW